ncbi:MAG: GAD domain-containing protein, partial [Clostridiaceae bacterium]
SVRAIKVPNSADMGRKQIDKLGEFVKTYKAKGLAWIAYKEGEIKSPISKFLKEEEMQGIIDKIGAEVGDLILILADKNSVVLQALGALRLEMA